MTDVASPSPDPAAAEPSATPAASSNPVSQAAVRVDSPYTPPEPPEDVPAEKSENPLLDNIDDAVRDLLGRLRLAATSDQARNVKAWVKERFG